MTRTATRRGLWGWAGPRETLVGTSPAIRAIRRRIAYLARRDTPVLISGESGTGRGLVARAIHSAERGFFCFAVSGVPAELMEAEVFGFERGAFDGAKERRPGMLECARGGTACFRHFDFWPRHLCPHLLRLVRDGVIVRMGGARSISVDLRIMVTTSTAPSTLVENGVLPRDLVRALAAGRVHLPPLRERGDDIAVLARHFTSMHAASWGDVDAGITDEALARLRAYHWPGNVRELSNVIERAFAMRLPRPWPTRKRARERPEPRPIDLAELPSTFPCSMSPEA